MWLLANSFEDYRFQTVGGLRKVPDLKKNTHCYEIINDDRRIILAGKIYCIYCIHYHEILTYIYINILDSLSVLNNGYTSI